MKTKRRKMTPRPARCLFCAGSLFYALDTRHLPSVRISLDHGPGSLPHETFEAHEHCWNEMMQHCVNS